MPNGKVYRPYRIPGKYCCIICRDLKDAEEFYKDSTRYNGCGSRCKKCDNRVREVRRQRYVGSAEALDAPSTKIDDSASRRQIKKRAEEIKSTMPKTPRKTKEPSDADKLIIFHKNGASSEELARYFGCDEEEIRRRGEMLGLSFPDPNPAETVETTLDQTTIERMRAIGTSYHQIATMFDVEVTDIFKICYDSAD